MAIKRFTEEEARLRKNERQREYQKRTHYASNSKSQKKNQRKYIISINKNTENDIIEKLDAEKEKDGYASYIKALIRRDLEE